MYSPDEIINYWFACYEPTPSYGVRGHWFNVDRAYEKTVRRRLMAYVVLASEESLKDWQGSVRGLLALTLLLDRFSRIVYRRTQMEFDNEIKARRLALYAVDRQRLTSLKPLEQVFQLFPLLSSERLNHQLVTKDCLIRLKLEAQDENISQLLDNLICLVDRNVLLLRKYRRFPHRADRQGLALIPEERRFVSDYEWQYWL